MCSGILCVHKLNFSVEATQCPQCTFTFRVRNITCEEQTNSFFLEYDQGFYVFEETQKSIHKIVGDDFCPGRYC